jgi:hypothetical protein
MSDNLQVSSLPELTWRANKAWQDILLDSAAPMVEKVQEGQHLTS